MIETIMGILKETYPHARCSLDFDNPLQALMAVILSAQCRDERVNQVTPALFAAYPNAEDLASAHQEDLEDHLKSLGLYRSKARNLHRLGEKLMMEYQGHVPSELPDLLSLPGVGRKTALCVLQEVFGQVEGVVVDTHVARLAHRLGWSRGKNVHEIEKDLRAQIPKTDWAVANHLLIAHGREICTAGNPRCRICPLQSLCPSAALGEKSTESKRNGKR